LIAEQRGIVATLGIKEFSPQGVRIEGNYEGVVRGKYNAIVTGTYTALIKPDGAREGELRELQYTKDSEAILVTGKYTGRMVGQAGRAAEAEITFQTTSKKLAWLNSTKGLLETTGKRTAPGKTAYSSQVYAVQ